MVQNQTLPFASCILGFRKSPLDLDWNKETQTRFTRYQCSHMPPTRSYNACLKPYTDIEAWLYPAAGIPPVQFLQFYHFFQLYLIFMIGSIFIPLVASIVRKFPFYQDWWYFFTVLMLLKE